MQLENYNQHGNYLAWASQYPESHWAMKIQNAVYEKTFMIDDVPYLTVVKVNPTDARYRLIISVHQPDNIGAYYNLPPTDKQFTTALKCCMDVATSLISIFANTKYAITTQIEFAGNNSMSSHDSLQVLGSANEPWMPHVHLILRTAKPDIAGVPNRSPAIGELFNMREGKVKWDKAELETFMGFCMDTISGAMI